jgi:hypothetical protein
VAVTDAFFDNRPSFMCDCTHKKGRHWNTVAVPNGPCRDCGCRAFTPEPLCVCGHGQKAHATKNGHCKESYKCGCKVFRPKP